MPELDITTDLRAGADNIHSIGPVQAANLLRAAAETIDDLRRDLWPGSGLPPLLSTTTIGALRSFAHEPESTYEATCTACEGEQFEGSICNACGDHVELADNGDGTSRRIYHSPAQIEQFARSED